MLIRKSVSKRGTKVFTTNYARYKRLPEGVEPISISQGIPGWFKGKRELRLAPSQEMLHMSRKDYTVAFDAQLATLDPKELFESLGDSSAILCWESPGIFCHRRRVAEWFEQSLGIKIDEYGYLRDEFPRYLDMPCKGSVDAKPMMKFLESRTVICPPPAQRLVQPKIETPPAEVYKGTLF